METGSTSESIRTFSLSDAIDLSDYFEYVRPHKRILIIMQFKALVDAHTHTHTRTPALSITLFTSLSHILSRTHSLSLSFSHSSLFQVSHDFDYESFCCDAVKLPLRSDAFDATICIAVLHHLASVGKLRISEGRENERRIGWRVLREGEREKDREMDGEGRGIGSLRR